ASSKIRERNRKGRHTMRELSNVEVETVSGGMCPCPGGGTQCPHDEFPEAGNGNGAHWTIGCGISGGMCPCPGGGTQCPHDEFPEAGNGNAAHWTIGCGMVCINGRPLAA